MSYEVLDKCDTFFDRYTPIPIVSTISGTGRVLYGLIETVYGLAQAIFCGFASIFDRYPNAGDFAFTGVGHFGFGMSNLFKGLFEMVPGVNFGVWAWNHFSAPLKREEMF